ncbi:MAG: virulence RhuM family protein [Tannerella sp.]|jgi:hypothetical protein|nr:virulence RhuM family protein [Tannerella sp.]
MKRAIITISDKGIVNVPNKSIRMTITEIAGLFDMYYLTAKKSIRSIEKSGIVSGDYSMNCTIEGQNVYPEYYGLEMIIAVAFRIHSPKAEIFRQWIIAKAARPDIPATLGISFQNAILN